MGLEETWELEDLRIWAVLGTEQAPRITGLGWESGVGRRDLSVHGKELKEPDSLQVAAQHLLPTLRPPCYPLCLYPTWL